ncbi:unnamed protein product [Adineta ricciae]|nr:unnamed protein product [Adineta ricciae]
MDVSLKWTYTYLPPSISTRTPGQRSKGEPANHREPLALLPDESVSGHKTLAEKQKEMRVKLKPQDVLGSDSDQKPKRDSPVSSSGIPASSVSRPVRDTNQNGHRHPRTASNASTDSKRVSFGHHDETPSTHPPNAEQSIEDETNHTMTPESSDIDPDPTKSTRYVDESDPDIIYRSTTSANSTKQDDVVTIGVHHLVLNENCSIFDDDQRDKVFVSVEFSNDREALDTPLSLIKGEPNSKYNFGFQTGYSIRDKKKRQQLAELVGPQTSGDIRFIVVAEPPDDIEGAECVDLGVATVNAKEILRTEKDIIEKNISVHDINEHNQIIGQMNVTVSMVNALQKVQQEEQTNRRIHT